MSEPSNAVPLTSPPLAPSSIYYPENRQGTWTDADWHRYAGRTLVNEGVCAGKRLCECPIDQLFVMARPALRQENAALIDAANVFYQHLRAHPEHCCIAVGTYKGHYLMELHDPTQLDWCLVEHVNRGHKKLREAMEQWKDQLVSGKAGIGAQPPAARGQRSKDELELVSRKKDTGIITRSKKPDSSPASLPSTTFNSTNTRRTPSRHSAAISIVPSTSTIVTPRTLSAPRARPRRSPRKSAQKPRASRRKLRKATSDFVVDDHDATEDNKPYIAPPDASEPDPVPLRITRWRAALYASATDDRGLGQDDSAGAEDPDTVSRLGSEREESKDADNVEEESTSDASSSDDEIPRRARQKAKRRIPSSSRESQVSETNRMGDSIVPDHESESDESTNDEADQAGTEPAPASAVAGEKEEDNVEEQSHSGPPSIEDDGPRRARQKAKSKLILWSSPASYTSQDSDTSSLNDFITPDHESEPGEPADDKTRRSVVESTPVSVAADGEDDDEFVESDDDEARRESSAEVEPAAVPQSDEELLVMPSTPRRKARRIVESDEDDDDSADFGSDASSPPVTPGNEDLPTTPRKRHRSTTPPTALPSTPQSPTKKLRGRLRRPHQVPSSDESSDDESVGQSSIAATRARHMS